MDGHRGVEGVPIPPDPAGPVTDNHPWLWRRLHGANDGEAMELTRQAIIAPTHPMAATVLAHYRLSLTLPYPEPDTVDRPALERLDP